MSDYDAIKETVFHYFEGYRDKDRERLEKAFSLEIANMMGYIKNEEGKLMRESIDKWVAPDYTPYFPRDNPLNRILFVPNLGFKNLKIAARHE
jgi:hypothetical protein